MIKKISSIINNAIGYQFCLDHFMSNIKVYNSKEILKIFKDLLFISELKLINQENLIGVEKDWSMHKVIQGKYNTLFLELYFNLSNKNKTKKTLKSLENLALGKTLLDIEETNLNQKTKLKLKEEGFNYTNELKSINPSKYSDSKKIKKYISLIYN